MSESREFKNRFPDFDGSTRILTSDHKLKNDMYKELITNIDVLLRYLKEELGVSSRASSSSDVSVYTGLSGIALLYYHLSKVFPEKRSQHLQEAIAYIVKALHGLNKHRISFLCGDPGPLAIASVIYHETGEKALSNRNIKHLEELSKNVIEPDPDLPDELLYGRVGYLFALLFVEKHLGKSTINEDIIKQVISTVLKSGRNLSKQLRHRSPLMYEWHEKPYLGAAHGLTGILYMLLQAREYYNLDDLMFLIKPSVDYIHSLQLPSGNYPSSLWNSRDKLIHWCHGAPGVVHLMSLAYEVFREEKYLTAAESCANVVWKKGLLKKGYGICHGVAGNAYTFLRLYQLTSDEKYLYRAFKFGEWCYDYGKHGCRTADRPFSLFEGLSGTIYFLADLLNPLRSAFPAFQLF